MKSDKDKEETLRVKLLKIFDPLDIAALEESYIVERLKCRIGE